MPSTDDDIGPGLAPRPSFGEAIGVWWRIALLSFGGPAGQIALMHRILVEEKRWIDEHRFLHALNFCMLLPGPEAQQLATYIGWLLHRTAGGLVAGTLFILPGFAAILALSYVYVLLGDVPLVEGLFFGLKAAVLAIVLQALIRIGRRTLRGLPALLLAVAAFLALFAFAIPFPLVILAAFVIGLLAGRMGSTAFAGVAHLPAEGVDAEELPPPARATLPLAALLLVLWLAPVLLLVVLLGPGNVFTEIAIFFSQMAVVTFGGAYAVLAYVAQQAVETYAWLQPGEMLDGLALAETTPGPLILVLQFVGFLAAYREAGGLPPLLAATLGAMLATWVTFLPCFVWIFLGAPFIERLRGNAMLASALGAITASVVGVIASLALYFALAVLFTESAALSLGPLSLSLPVPRSLDPAALLLTLAAMLALLVLRIGVVPTLLGAALAGMAWTGLVQSL